MAGKIKWTSEQLDAIRVKDSNLLVAAAAGAGKTAVLVERIIQRIMDPRDPVDIDRLLVVTFTNAAATEMKERIGDALSDALENQPESEVLQRQLALLNRASITTIHSFCLEVIKNNFHQLDIDPNFRIANETEGLLLKLEALEELFEDRYLKDDMDEDFLDLVESYSSNRDDKRLQDMVLRLYDFVQSHPWPEEWLHNHSRTFNIPDGTDLGNTPWGKELLESTRVEVMGLAESMAQAIDIIEGDPGLQPYLKNFVEEHSAIEAILKGFHDGWESVQDYVSKVDFKRLSRCGKDADKDKQERVKKIRDNAKAGIGKIEDKLFAVEPDQVIRDLRSLYPKMKCLTDLVLELGERYRAKKRDKGLVDFNDLEHMCLEILLDEDEDGKRIPSEIALKLRDRYEEVLVDEYQDSNLVQEVILTTVSRKDDQRPNMFMVGDVKQSIYRFRQARPELFLEKYASYSLKPGSRDRKIQLFKNFRSRKSVIDGVNFIFSQIMSQNVGELDYNDEEALNLGAVFKEGAHGESPEGEPVEFHIIDMKVDSSLEDAEPYQNTSPDYRDFGEDDEDSEDGDEGLTGGEPLDIIQTEARIIARRILELVSPEGKEKPARIFDKAKGDYRKAEFRDIVILLRTTVNWADTFQEELSLQGIPAYSDSGTGYFKTIEVQTMLSLLQIIDNPMQDIPLLAVLRSPIESWSPEELIDVRLVDRESTLYEALVKKAREGEGRLAQKALAFIEKLNSWRDISQYMSTDELIWYLYGETGYYSCVGALPGGVQRQANLRILFERARQYEETSYKGLFNFILYIDRLKTSQGDMGSAKILGENENVVRIMSIHKSKGLEFPIVFVAGCGKKFNLMDTTRNILFHHDLGLGPDYVDFDRRIIYSTLAKESLKHRITLETLSEEMRILYVALTRARERLIITGAVKDLEREVGRWADALAFEGLKLPEYETMRARRFLDWIGPVIIRHEDGTPLRQILDPENTETYGLINHESRWKLYLHNKADAMGVEISQDSSLKSGDFLWEIGEEDEISLMDEVTNRLGWKYSHEQASRLPVKVSVTELKRHLDTEFSEEIPTMSLAMPTLIRRPSFLEEEARSLTSAEWGSLLHFVLQHLDCKRATSGDAIRDQIEDMVKVQLITEEQARVVDILRIERFLQSPLGIRMLRAEKIFKEVPFTIELPSTRLYPELSGSICENDGIILQGIVDCYFEEPEGIVLVDYKTDYVAPKGGLQAIRDRYKAQIDYYAYALEGITDKKVIGRYIYLFWNGQVLEF
ncbi:MAG: helicase-exonuclease AddAB subunit AddA [Clostridiales bacterium]|nr:helicase-exonuclease AddAB subunit AddA [Clostridiales bacterium]